MLSYQDLLLNENNKEAFILSVINDYKSSDMYHWAYEAENYSRQKNTVITKYQKLLRTASGRLIPNIYAANHKMCSNFFKRFITQENQFLLGNGVSFEEEIPNLGKDFDYKLQKAGYEALKAGVSYVFFNFDHIDVFPALQFAPLFDEEDGSLKAGVRFWQIDSSKPIRATLFELDGYTEYIFNSRDKKKKTFEVLQAKRAYKTRLYESPVLTIYEGMNYPSFPIIPFWGNEDHQSELVGLKEEIDSFDLIISGFANDLDDCSQIYWLVENAGGMDEEDLAEFLARIARNHIAETRGGGEGSKITPYTQEIPYESRKFYLESLENTMYKDAMALNTERMSSSNVTATAIACSYEPLNNKTDAYEYCVRQVIDAILKLIEVDVDYSFKRSMIANQSEVTQMVLSSSEYLDTETILKKLPFIENDEVEEIMGRLEKEETERFEEEEETPIETPQETEPASNEVELPEGNLSVKVDGGF